MLSCSDATRSSDDGAVAGHVDASYESGASGKEHDATSRDATASEARPTPTRDATLDASRDASHDASRDATRDATRDAALDTSHDASLDTLRDAPLDAGPPSLISLSVSQASVADSSPPSALVPPFSPDIHDYYVRCAAGTNELTVSMTASEGASSRLVQPTASPSAPQQRLAVSVTENEALVAAATRDAVVTEYWVRCLPHDFPLLQWTPHADSGTPAPGYYLLGTAEPTRGCYSMALDHNGVPVWYVPAVTASDGWCVFDVDSIETDAISFDAVSDVHAEFELHQLAPLVTTLLAPIGNKVNLHDLRPLANGSYLVLSSPQQTVDLTGMQLPLQDGGVQTLSGPQTILGCDLVEFAPDGTVTWTWTGADHLNAVEESVAPVLSADGSLLVIDPFHCDSVDVDPANGNVLVSSRQMSSVFYVDRSTGRILWKMGGTRFNQDHATYVSLADPFLLQHDARLQPDWSASCNGGSGHVSVFDDQTGGTRPARGVVYDVLVGLGDGGAPVDGGCHDAGPPDGLAAGTATVSWQYETMVSSLCMGSVRSSPDGSYVVGWGYIPGAGFTEVDSSGHDLLDFGFADGNTSYRTIKVPLSALDLGVLRSTAGLP
jgi:hypothetical protein